MRSNRSRRTRAAVAAGALGLLLSAAGAAPVPPDDGEEGPPSADELAAIEELGFRIARHIEAHKKAATKLADMRDEIAPLVDGTVVMEGKTAWRVLFLKEPPPQDARRGPVVMARIDYYPAAGEVGQPNMMVPPREAPAATASHYRALQVALVAAARAEGRPGALSGAVSRIQGGRFVVHVMSDATEDGHARFGGDSLARIAATGRQLEEIQPLHAGPPIDLPIVGRSAGEPTLHTHAEGERPTATDVARVILEPRLAPHLVLTPNFMYRIDATGRITFLGINPAPAAGGRAGTP